MAYEQYSFFNSTDDDDRSYGAEIFAEYFASFIGNGVFNGGDCLRAYADGTARSIKVKPGRAWINGYYYALKEDDEGAEYVLETAPADAANDRIDAVVLRLDTAATARSMRLRVISGEPAASPVAPAPVRSGNIYDLVLAHVFVNANTSVVQATAVTDKRLVNELCGLVNSLITVDTTAMQELFDARMEAWDNTVSARGKAWDNMISDCNAEWTAKLASVQGVLDSKAPAVHTHAASDIQAGTLGGKVVANTTAAAALAEAQVRNIKAQTANLTAGTSSLANGEVVLVYE